MECIHLTYLQQIEKKISIIKLMYTHWSTPVLRFIFYIYRPSLIDMFRETVVSMGAAKNIYISLVSNLQTAVKILNE